MPRHPALARTCSLLLQLAQQHPAAASSGPGLAVGVCNDLRLMAVGGARCTPWCARQRPSPAPIWALQDYRNITSTYHPSAPLWHPIVTAQHASVQRAPMVISVYCLRRPTPGRTHEAQHAAPPQPCGKVMLVRVRGGRGAPPLHSSGTECMHGLQALSKHACCGAPCTQHGAAPQAPGA